MVERNAGVPEDRRIVFRIGIHVGDVVEESDGDLMRDGVNIAARLQGVAEPGAICLSEDAYRQVKSRLDLKVSDLGPTQLKNIAEPVHVYSPAVGQPAQAKPAPSATPADPARSPAPKPRFGLVPFAAAIAALLLLASAGGWTLLGWRGVKPAEAAHLSVVVLPFANLSGDPGQDYFADGVTEKLTTELSRIRSSFVIARNTAFRAVALDRHSLLAMTVPRRRAAEAEGGSVKECRLRPFQRRQTAPYCRRISIPARCSTLTSRLRKLAPMRFTSPASGARMSASTSFI